MQAVTMVPGTAGSAKLEHVPEPRAALGSVVVEALAVGVGSPSTSMSGPDSLLASGAVLKNLVMFGSVNANRALARTPVDIKVVMEFTS